MPLRARRGAAGRGGCSKSRPRRAGRTWSRPCRPTCRPPTAPSASSSAPSRRFGRLDILVNNVGKAGGGDIARTSDAEWQSAFDQTLFPAIRMSRLAVPHMRAARRRRDPHDRVDLGPRIGRPHDLQRRQGRRDQPRRRRWRSSSRPDNIRVNSVAPGSILFEGGIVVEAPAGRSRGHRRVRQPRAAVRPLRPRRRSRRASSRSSPRRARAGSRGACITVDGGQSQIEHLNETLDFRTSVRHVWI